MQRVLVIGSPGSGKSTWARRLGVQTSVPVVHLDAHYWQAGARPVPRTEWQARLQDVLAQPRWIVDGHYASSLGERLQRADTVVYLDYARWRCMLGLLRRVWCTPRANGAQMPTLPRWDWRFWRKVWLFRQQQRPRDMALLQQWQGHYLRFSYPRQLKAWMASLPAAPDGAG